MGGGLPLAASPPAASAERPERERAATRLLAVGLVLTVVARLVLWIFTWGHPLVGDEFTYHQIAVNWLDGPAGMSYDGVHPTAYVGPMYPALVAGLYALFGRGEAPVVLFQIGLAVATGWLVYRIGERLTGRRFLPALAVLGLALYYPLADSAVRILTETSFTFLLVWTVDLVLRGMRSGRSGPFVAAGVVAGISVLSRPNVLVFVPVLLAVLIWHFRPRIGQALVRTALFTAALALVVAPWTIRNYRLFHAFIPVASQGGFVFWSGTYPEHGGFSMITDPFPPHIQRFRDSNPSEAAMNAMFTREAIHNIRANPGHWVKLAGVKFVRLWFNLGFPKPPSRASFVLAFGHLAMLLLAALAIGRVPDRHGLMLVVMVVAAMTLLHMVTIGLVRYAYPMIPFVMLLAAIGAGRLLERGERTGA